MSRPPNPTDDTAPGALFPYPRAVLIDDEHAKTQFLTILKLPWPLAKPGVKEMLEKEQKLPLPTTGRQSILSRYFSFWWYIHTTCTLPHTPTQTQTPLPNAHPPISCCISTWHNCSPPYTHQTLPRLAPSPPSPERVYTPSPRYPISPPAGVDLPFELAKQTEYPQCRRKPKFPRQIPPAWVGLPLFSQDIPP